MASPARTCGRYGASSRHGIVAAVANATAAQMAGDPAPRGISREPHHTVQTRRSLGHPATGPSPDLSGAGDDVVDLHPCRVVMKPDYYGILGVAAGADRAAIREAYRKLARRCHPDLTGGSESRMIALNAAWSVLGDPAAREAYDQSRSRRAPATAAAATGGRPEPSAASGPEAGAAGPAPRRHAAGRPGPGSDGEVLEFGRYAGCSLRDLVRRDPNYLDWLAHTPLGRRYRDRIDALLAPSPRGPAAAPLPRRRSGLFGRR